MAAKPVRSLRTLARAALLIGLLVTCVAGGCREPRVSSNHEVLGGTVEGLRADTFDLTIRPGERWAERSKHPTISCLLTNADIYVNDRFSSFDTIAIGDTVELVGYFEQSTPGRFVVSFAFITRNEPLPPEPDLSPPPAEPTRQPKES